MPGRMAKLGEEREIARTCRVYSFHLLSHCWDEEGVYLATSDAGLSNPLRAAYRIGGAQTAILASRIKSQRPSTRPAG